METVSDVSVLRARIKFWRRGNQRIAFVPTMGNLHAGHLRLVEQARKKAERVVVSCFVNPMQFGPGEDLDQYPRTLEADQRALENLGVDLLFLPATGVMYPRGHAVVTRVEVPGLGERLCGETRPGHFAGVTTVVAKLFNIVQPDTAVFGTKDYQQLTIIRRMVADLCWPIEIDAVATVREPSGLAMSSRNQYLTPEERVIAPRLYQTLRGLVGRIQAGERDYPGLQTEAMESLAAQGFAPEYVAVLQADDLEPPGDGKALILLTAARLGKTRLIDNVLI